MTEQTAPLEGWAKDASVPTLKTFYYRREIFGEEPEEGYDDYIKALSLTSLERHYFELVASGAIPGIGDIDSAVAQSIKTPGSKIANELSATIGEQVVDTSSPAGYALYSAYAPDKGGKPVGKGELVVSVKDFYLPTDIPGDDHQAIQRAVWYVKDTPSINVSTIQFERNKVYSVGQKLYAYSNSTWDLNGSTLVRNFDTGPGGASLLQFGNSTNLTIKNGTLDGNGANFQGPNGNGFNICGGTSIKELSFSQVTFKDVVGAHSIDVSDIDGLYVDRCNFLGYKNVQAPNPDRSFSEAIQLDPNGLDGATGSPVSKVRITNCFFGKSGTAGFSAVAVGIGNHASVVGQTTSDVTISDCVFEGCTFAGITPYRWENFTIERNTFRNCVAMRIQPMTTAEKPVRGNGGRVLNNDITGVSLSIDAIIGWWQTNLEFRGNTIRNARNALSLRFIRNLYLVGNTIENCASGLWLNEGTETAYSGQGETFNIIIAGNTFYNVNSRAAHINCAARNITLEGNKAYNVSTATDLAVPAFAFDSSSSDIFINNNHTSAGTALNKPSYGVIVSSSCTDVAVGTNKLYGKTAPILNSST